MRTSISILFILLISCTSLTGCWDMIEPNERSLWVASGLDLEPNGMIKSSGQILIPSQISNPSPGSSSSSGGSKTAIYTGIGMNIRDSLLNVEKKMSRRVFVGHRFAIFFGETLSKHGIKHLLDEPGRNPESDLRLKVFIVKGDAMSFLQGIDPLERSSALWAVRSNYLNGMKNEDATMRRFKSDLLSSGIRPMLPVVEIIPEMKDKVQKDGNNSKPMLQLKRIALFNKSAQMVGYLKGNEAQLALWISGKLRKKEPRLTGGSDFEWTENIPTKKGPVTVNIHHISRQLTPQIKGNKIHMQILLSGYGDIMENNSGLDLSHIKDITVAEHVINQGIKNESVQMIKKVQQQYKLDVFGFGNQIHYHYPKQWRLWKADWDNKFPSIDTSVKVKLLIKSTGNQGK
jgi:spore germination protein KC